MTVVQFYSKQQVDSLISSISGGFAGTITTITKSGTSYPVTVDSTKNALMVISWLTSAGYKRNYPLFFKANNYNDYTGDYISYMIPTSPSPTTDKIGVSYSNNVVSLTYLPDEYQTETSIDIFMVQF